MSVGVGAASVGVSSMELMRTTSSLKTAWGRDLANSERESEDLMYSAAQLRRSFWIADPSGVSFHTETNSGVDGIR